MVAVDAGELAVEVRDTVAELTVTSTLRDGVGIADAVKLVADVIEAEEEEAMEVDDTVVDGEALESTDVVSAVDLSWLFTHPAASSEKRSK